MTVSGQSPVVDITLDEDGDQLRRERAGLAAQRARFLGDSRRRPAVQMQRIDVGGSAAGTQTGYSTYDTKADQHRPMVEGIVNTEGTNAAGFYYDYGSFDEVSVATGTNTAEMPWPGVMSQFISKSGGNTYHGKIYADYESENIQSRNIDADQIKLGLKAGGGLHRNRSESPAQLLRPERRRRRLPEAGQDLVAWLAARPEGADRCCRISRSSRSRRT